MRERQREPCRGVHAPENTDPDLGKHTWDHLVAPLPLNLARRAAQRVTAQAHGAICARRILHAGSNVLFVLYGAT